MIDSNEGYRQNIAKFFIFANNHFSVDDLMDVKKLKTFASLWSNIMRDEYKDELGKLGWDWIGYKRTQVLKFFEAVGKGTIEAKR